MVLPRSGRLLGLSLEKNSVTDFERFFCLAVSKSKGTLSTRRAGGFLVSPGIRCCRRGDTGLASRRALLTGSDAMLPLAQLLWYFLGGFEKYKCVVERGEANNLSSKKLLSGEVSRSGCSPAPARQANGTHHTPWKELNEALPRPLPREAKPDQELEYLRSRRCRNSMRKELLVQ